MKTYKIFKSSLKVRKLEKVLNKIDGLGYTYVDIILGRGFFFPCAYVIAVAK